MANRERLTDESLLAAISAAEQTALGGISGAVSSDREDATKRYYGLPYGDELPGRSQVVSRDVADVVEGVTANVVKPFVGGDKVIQFDPISEEDEKAAEQETDYVNFVALERNDGFVWLVSAIKDALLLRNGYVKCGWEVRQDIITETYAGQDDDELAALLSDKDVEVMEHSEYPDPYAQPANPYETPPGAMNSPYAGGSMPSAPAAPGPMLHDVKVRRVRPTEYTKVEPVPPDEILISERARSPSLQNVDFVQFRPRKSLSELRQAGYDVPDDISDDDRGDTIEDITRQRFGQGNTWDDSTGQAARRMVLFKESYIRIDRDGDGVAELRKVCSVGQTILADEDCDIVPIACFSGVLVPHQHLGMSIYDLCQDIAIIKTALLRSFLDNRNLQNNARVAVNATNVNLDDLLVSRPGGIIRVDGDPAANIVPIITPDTSSGALQGLEYLDTIREQRTGYTRNSAGIDNDALTNRTATGMQMQLSQSQLRLEMIARTIAETGIRDVFRIIHALTLKHSSHEEKVRLKGKWVQVNPREWVRRTDLSIAIGLGTGTSDQQLAKLMGLAPMLQTLQPMGLVGTQQAYNFATEAFKLSGYKAPDRFVKPPQIDPQTGEAQEPPQQPPPEVQVAQMKIQGEQQIAQGKAQSDVQKFQAQAQADRERLQMEDASKQRALAAEQVVQQSNDQRDAVKAQMDAQSKREQFMAEIQAKDAMHMRELQAKDIMHQRDQETAIKIAYINAQAKTDAAAEAATASRDNAVLAAQAKGAGQLEARP